MCQKNLRIIGKCVSLHWNCSMLDMLKYIADKEHYTEVLSRCGSVKHDLWIATADLKDLYVAKGKYSEPFLAVLDRLLHRGVEVRLLHAKEPGENFRQDFDHYPGLWSGLDRRLCLRVHFKIMILDCTTAYIGSANLTGAGMGMKSIDGRNFEAGILTDEPSLVDAAADHLDSVWRGSHCGRCRHKHVCGDRIDTESKD